MAAVKEVSSSKCFGGHQKVYSHESKELKCSMNFSIYVPPKAEDNPEAKFPVVYWLSGLTCTEQNFIIKSGFQRYAAEHNLVVVGPDTSPRGVTIEGQDDDWDFGSGAGFYVDATEAKWKEHYRMYSYVTKELIEVVEANFPFVKAGRRGISGHSMGGHGALTLSLKNPGLYQSVSAFAPIANPIDSPWGQKAFTGYLGSDKSTWKDWDATEVVAKYNGPPLNILIDQGSADPWLVEELKPQQFVVAAAQACVATLYRVHDGYDHGYFFVGTFLNDHFKHHADILFAEQ